MQDSAADPKLWHIKNCPLFRELTHDELLAIRSAAQMYDLSKNKAVPAPPGDEPSLFIVKKGHVQLSYVDEGGKEAVVILLGPGDVFGSLAADDDRFGQHCRTVSEASVCRISRPRFESMLRKYPDLAFTLTKLSMSRIQRLQVRLAEMMMRPANERLALALLDLDGQVGRDEPDGRRKLGLALTHADLAKLIGTTREMVTILFSKFRKAGWIQTEKGWIYLADMDGLRALAGKA